MSLGNNLNAKTEKITGKLSVIEDSVTLEPNNHNFIGVSPTPEIFEDKFTNVLISSRLEQLASTNLLTLRFKYGAPTTCKHSNLLDEIEAISHLYKGCVRNTDCLEPYEFMNDKERMKILEENKDVYLYERGTEEYASSGGEVDNTSDWRYDIVIQIQFKKSNLLKIVCEKVHSIFLKGMTKGTIQKWSISINKRALTQPGNLYVRGIPKDWSLNEISLAFSKFGPITSVKIICDSETNQSLGYGFFSYSLGSQASNCIKELNGKSIGDSVLFINYHVERKERERMHKDHIRGNGHEEDFKAVFVGNLPTRDNENNILCPEDVIELFKSRLSLQFTDLTIISFYFPKKNKPSTTESKISNDRNKTSPDESKCDNTNYGFIKFLNHQQAITAISTFHNFYWHGKNLIVNQAIPNKRGYINYYTQRNGVENFNKYRPSKSSPPFGSTISDSSGSFGSYFLTPPSAAVMTVGSRPHPSSPVSNPILPALASTEIDPTLFGFVNPYGFIPQPAYGVLQHNKAFGLPLPTKEQQESNLYVKHLPLFWKDENLHDFYRGFGEIISAKIITVGGSKIKKKNNNDVKESSDLSPYCRSIGTSRGYGFICFKNPLDASRALLATNGFRLSESNVLNVSFAQKTAKNGSRSDKSDGTAYNQKFLRAMRYQQLNTWKPLPYLPLAPVALAMPQLNE